MTQYPKTERPFVRSPVSAQCSKGQLFSENMRSLEFLTLVYICESITRIVMGIHCLSGQELDEKIDTPLCPINIRLQLAALAYLNKKTGHKRETASLALSRRSKSPFRLTKILLGGKLTLLKVTKGLLTPLINM